MPRLHRGDLLGLWGIDLCGLRRGEVLGCGEIERLRRVRGGFGCKGRSILGLCGLRPGYVLDRGCRLLSKVCAGKICRPDELVDLFRLSSRNFCAVCSLVDLRELCRRQVRGCSGFGQLYKLHAWDLPIPEHAVGLPALRRRQVNGVDHLLGLHGRAVRGFRWLNVLNVSVGLLQLRERHEMQFMPGRQV